MGKKCKHLEQQARDSDIKKLEALAIQTAALHNISVENFLSALGILDVYANLPVFLGLLPGNLLYFYLLSKLAVLTGVSYVFSRSSKRLPKA
jgi:hypothetical protein